MVNSSSPSPGVPSYNILALTFTRAAAEELRIRVRAMMAEYTGEPLSNLRFSLKTSTFHSFCFTILRINAKLLGYDEISLCSEGQQVHALPLRHQHASTFLLTFRVR